MLARTALAARAASLLLRPGRLSARAAATQRRAATAWQRWAPFVGAWTGAGRAADEARATAFGLGGGSRGSAGAGAGATQRRFSAAAEKKGGDDEDEDEDAFMPNVMFHRNALRLLGTDVTIDVIHKTWPGNYELLEGYHAYIQWLFPIPTQSMFNEDSFALEPAEARIIRETPECRERVARSYVMMLDFYGLELADAATGKLRPSRNAADRLRHLNSSPHNWLRMTRILTALGMLGYPHYKTELLAVLGRLVDGGTLSRCRSSYERFWTRA